MTANFTGCSVSRRPCRRRRRWCPSAVFAARPTRSRDDAGVGICYLCLEGCVSPGVCLLANSRKIYRPGLDEKCADVGTRESPLNFTSHALDLDLDSGILEGIFTLVENSGKIQQYCGFFEWWDVSPAEFASRNFETELLSLGDKAN